ncbi:hypothetical protein E1B28_012672 [Marasmius oreades]|uniref:3-beta hydroxysteroid dehydrogenase/isomerase domain-containing protein n=1 Tax=Marasmius oreades TaxID=181124 RepID=A0A9P7RSL0_9AGAR|nr:uncharacterized protein E1B28_012672 [Marasmius oreades]KAG7088702.1 hypothetical protein E1B28_012672 [Marasmius oreades]
MRFLVIGGSGFLGSHIIEALRARRVDYKQPISIAVYDIVKPLPEETIDAVTYYVGDIVNEAKLTEVMKEFQPNLVFHTASPLHGLPPAVYYRVNVEGTRTVFSSCRAASVKNVIYTSSMGVIWTGAELDGVSEDQVSIPKHGYDAYHHTKAAAELISLDENGVDGMRVVVLRPCGIFGERDKQMFWRMAEVLEKGQQNVQIGSNTSLVDYAYVGNVAHAHVLAADKLLTEPDTVTGQVFFITNGTPMTHWNFARMVFKALGDDGTKKVVVIPRSIAMVMAVIAEIWAKITGQQTTFTRFSIASVTNVQWFNIEKARKILNYEPQVSLEEGVQRTAQWWKKSGATQHKAQEKKNV